MSEIFREVDEALREDRAKAVWQKYGTLLISMVTVIILATGGYVFWQDYAERRDQDLTGVLLTALEASDSDPAAAIDARAALGDDASDRQGVIARLHEAALRAEASSPNSASAAIAAAGSESRASSAVSSAPVRFWSRRSA